MTNNQKYQIAKGNSNGFPVFFTENSRSLPDNLDVVTFVNRFNEETCLPWDNGFEILSNKLVISGHLEAQGFGSVSVSIPIDSANDFFFVDVGGSEYDNELVDVLIQYGYTTKPV